MRRLLDTLYLTGGVVAGVCIVLMAILILAQVVTRWFDVIIPSTEDFSGFLLAAASFLALAYTLRSGGHIRVNMLITHFHGRLRVVIEAVVLIIALILVSYTAWATSYLTYESYLFEEVSQGYIAVPLWIPQVPMAVGLVVLTIALSDELVLLLRGEQPHYLENDESEVISTEERL